MLLYLLRHADAVLSARNDAARELTEKGTVQARQVGKFCRWNKLVPEVILASPLRRAEQTARLFADAIEAPRIVQVVPFLASGMQPDAALAELKAYLKLKSVMLVGHEPDLGHLAAKLLGSNKNDVVKIRKASLTLFETESAQPGSAVLQFSIPVKLM